MKPRLSQRQHRRRPGYQTHSALAVQEVSVNPEEEYNQWWNKNRSRIIAASGPYQLKLDCRKAFELGLRLGHSQGMTRAAEICEEEKRGYELYSSTHFGEPLQHYHACITAILTKRDKEEK